MIVILQDPSHLLSIHSNVSYISPMPLLTVVLQKILVFVYSVTVGSYGCEVCKMGSFSIRVKLLVKIKPRAREFNF